MIEALRDVQRAAQSAFRSAAASTATVTVAAATAYTTGGTALAAQTAAAGQTYRVRAWGNFTAVSSATARNGLIAPFWGTTQLPGVTVAVLVSSAQTSAWEAEFVISTTSTTAAWTFGKLLSRLASATLYALGLNTPASTTVTAGALAIDLRFAVSAVVAGDSWSVQSVTIERIK